MSILSEQIIPEDKINDLMSLKPEADKIDEILNKALELKGLKLEETAYCLNIEDDEHLKKLFKTAKIVKEKIYGKQNSFVFAPLYLSNYCTNNCLYCGFRSDNKEIKRRKSNC